MMWSLTLGFALKLKYCIACHLFRILQYQVCILPKCPETEFFTSKNHMDYSCSWRTGSGHPG